MAAPTEHVFDDDMTLIEALEQRVLEILQQALSMRGRATLAVSGGNTPRPLFARLAQAELPWSQVDLTLVDERWVDITDDASNEKMLRATLLTGPAAAARFIPLKNAAPTAAQGVASTMSALATLQRPFDLVLLGMGDDGHTASLFPGAPELAFGLSTALACLSVTPPKAPHERLTLSAHRLLDTRHLVLHLSGAQKLRTLREVQQDGPVEEHPIRFFLRQQQVPMDIYVSR